MQPRNRTIPANVLAALALTSAAVALPASCGAPEAVNPSELVAAVAESSSELRASFDEHREWYGAVELDPALPQEERDEARRLHAEIADLLDSLSALNACEKEGWSRETVFISDLVGQLEEAIDVHVSHIAEAQTELELRVEEGVYAIKVVELMDELDRHIDAAKIEAEQRPSSRCRPSARRLSQTGGVPRI
jgi:hypothetical protein